MIKNYLYICICFLSAWLCSCTDESLYTEESNQVGLDLQVNFPLGIMDEETRASGTDAGSGLDYETAAQRYIYKDDNGYDIYLLVYEKRANADGSNWVLKEVPEITIQGSEFNYLFLKSVLEYSKETKVKFELLVNLVSSDSFLSETTTSLTTSQVKAKLEELIGMPEQQVQQTVIFNHPQNNWALSEDNPKIGYLPMSGKCLGEFIPKKTIKTDCNLYRSVAKIGVKVDAECTNFDLKEVWLFYTNQRGYCISSRTPDSDINIQYTEPDAISSIRAKEDALKYIVANGMTMDEIAVAEVENIGANQPMVIMVGGIYTGPDGKPGNDDEGISDASKNELTYYRIDLKNKGANGRETAYNIIRNHSYIYNIKKATSPGIVIPDPEDKTATLEVEVMSYTEEPMKGINTQYTLEVDRNVFGFEGLCVNALNLNIKTDGTQWELSHSHEDYATPDWLILDDIEKEHTSNSGRVTIMPTPNNTKETRTGYFYVQAGKIKKRITVIQEPAETANSYLITQPGEYLLQTNVKGNGVGVALTQDFDSNNPDAQLNTINIDFGKGTGVKGVKSVAIIWSTAKNLIEINSDKAIMDKNGYITTIPYTVKEQASDLQWKGTPFQSGYGANALIGAFSEEGGKGTLLWSWHIWVVFDYKNGVITEQWPNGYDFMDRNLGAYSNEPGSRSLGLLYQWGRKDPFIGAVREMENGTYERDYHKVKKMANTLYYPDTHYWRDWDESNDGKETLVNTFSRPTVLSKNGFLSNTNDDTQSNIGTYKGLWGTTSNSIEVHDNGIKTMYDPCPPGYRVPPVHAFYFEHTNGNNEYNTYNDNYSYNNRYVPQHIVKTKIIRTYNDEDKLTNDGTVKKTENVNINTFVSDAPFYGFWINFRENKQPTVEQYLKDNKVNPRGGQLTGGSRKDIAWFPLAGIYNGTIQHFGRIGRSSGRATGYPTVPKMPASSIHMNSIVWLNAPTAENKAGKTLNTPAGFFLHGTEGAYVPYWSKDGKKYYYGNTSHPENKNEDGEYEAISYNTKNGGFVFVRDDDSAEKGTHGDGKFQYKGISTTIAWEELAWKWDPSKPKYIKWDDINGGTTSGRHLHRLDEQGTDLLAGPQFAGSIRCIRDKDRVIVENNKIYTDDNKLYNGKSLTLSASNSYKQNLVVSSVEDWHVIHPGAKWITVTPDNLSNSGNGGVTNISITAKATEAVQGDYTVIIKFSRGIEQKINLTVK